MCPSAVRNYRPKTKPRLKLEPMKLTLIDLHKLTKKVSAARKLLKELEQTLVETVTAPTLNFNVEEDCRTIQYLMDVLSRVDNAAGELCVVEDAVRPVHEWVGGDRWKWREPIGIKTGRGYYNEDVVKAYGEYLAELTQAKKPPGDDIPF